MEKICGIYCIENTVNNKKYIGQSIDVSKRLTNHKSALKHDRHRNSHLQSAWNAQKGESFDFYIIERCGEDLLDEMEKFYITKFDCMNPKHGYNFEAGGNDNRHPSEEVRRKMSESHIGLQVGEKNPSYGIPKSDEVKKKISETQKKRFKNKEDHPRYGAHLSEESKQKISEKITGMFAGEKHHFYGKHWNEEERKKISQNKGGKSIYCPELDEFFWGAAAAEEKYGVSHSNIIACCRGKRHYTGRHPITNEPLHWIYIENNINT